MLRRVGQPPDIEGAAVKIGDAQFPAGLGSGLEYASPARGAWNIVHTGMLIPEAHEIFVCGAGCLRGVVLTAAEMNAQERFSTIAVRENNLLDGDMEQLIIEGVADILTKLPKKPPAVLVYTSCVHHFTGCDLDSVYKKLRARFPDIDFTDCYMNPIMRKSGLTPDELMRSRLYSLLKPRERNPRAAAIIGNDLPLDDDCELKALLRENGFKIHEITSCKSYKEYQRMAESSYYISCYPSAVAGGEQLQRRLGGEHIYISQSFDSREIDAGLERLCGLLGIPLPELSEKRALCDRETAQTLACVGETPIAIDYSFCPRPLSLARLLLDKGFKVFRVYADSISGEERSDFDYLKAHFPELELRSVTNVKMRFLAEKEKTTVLALGQKAAYFENTDNFVNLVEGGGMLGYEAIIKTMGLMRRAHTEKQDMRSLIQIKGLGCDCCI